MVKCYLFQKEMINVGERYWITGVQLGILKASCKNLESELIDEIIDKQFIGDKEHLDNLLEGHVCKCKKK